MARWPGELGRVSLKKPQPVSRGLWEGGWVLRGPDAGPCRAERCGHPQCWASGIHFDQGVPRDLMAPLGGVLEVEISWLPCPEQRSPRGQPKDLLGIAARTLLPAGRGARVTGASRTWRFWAHSGGVSACAHRPRTSPSSAHSVATCARTRRPHRVIEGTPRTRRLSSHPSDTAADLNLRTANILQSSFLWRKLLPSGNLAKPKTKELYSSPIGPLCRRAVRLGAACRGHDCPCGRLGDARRQEVRIRISSERCAGLGDDGASCICLRLREGHIRPTSLAVLPSTAR